MLLQFSFFSFSLASSLFSKPELIAEKSFPFAHEAGIYVPSLNSVYFTSNILKFNDRKEIAVSRLNLDNYAISYNLSLPIPMANGGCLTPKNTLLFCGQGNNEKPAGLYEFDPQTGKVVALLTDYQGKPYSSPNDVIIGKNGDLWFTDPPYGYSQKFRPFPALPPSVYHARYNNGSIEQVKAVIFNIVRPNGIAVSNDEKYLFVTETGRARGDGTEDETVPVVIYRYEIVNDGPRNRILFASVDKGIPDGIKIDANGLVYVGCGDGVRIYDQSGKLLETVYVDGGIANFSISKSRLILLNEKRIYIAKRLLQ